MNLIYPNEWYQRFDKPSERFDEVKKALEFHAFEDLLEGAQRGASLDIGTATGRYLLASLRHGFDAIGIDYNDNAVISTRSNLTRARVSSERVIRMDARHLQYGSHSLSLVTCMMATIAHTIDYRLILNEIARVLRPNGRFVFSIWQPSNPNFGNFLLLNSQDENQLLADICRAMHPVEKVLHSSSLRVLRKIEIINLMRHHYDLQDLVHATDRVGEWVWHDQNRDSPDRLNAGEMAVYCCARA